MILFDTDICIDLLRGNANILRRREQYEEGIGISFMTVAELYYGAEKSPNPQDNGRAVEQLLLTLDIVQSDIQILKRFGILKAYLYQQHLPLADADVFIAATTLEKATRLITGNSKHFERIPGLVLENWR